MKLLEQKDYILIFIKGSQYDNTEKIAAYFEGKYIEVKECNPMELYLDGLHKAFQFFEKQLKDAHQEEMQHYNLSLRFEPTGDHEKPDINDNSLPAPNIHREFTGHYNYQMIQRIKCGLDKFAQSKQGKIESIHDNDKNNESDLFNDLENKFNGMPIKEVEGYFIQLTKSYPENDGAAFLTKEQFNLFIKCAFREEKVAKNPKIKFTLAGRKKGAIIKLFRVYHKICTQNNIERSLNQRDRYVRLLTDYFDGFKFSQVRVNFRESHSFKWPIRIYGQFKIKSSD